MLVLSREKGQEVVINGPCVLKIVDVRAGKKVRLGFEADPSVIIDRREVHESKLAAIEAAETAVTLANKAIEDGALITAAKANRAKQIEHTQSAAANRAAAVRLRKSADKVDDVLSGLVQGIAGGIRVKNERLVIDTDRGETLFSELSEGERWKVAINVCVDVVGSTGLMVIPQDAWEGLDPINRNLIGSHARKCGVTIITAEATADEEIYATSL